MARTPALIAPHSTPKAYESVAPIFRVEPSNSANCLLRVVFCRLENFMLGSLANILSMSSISLSSIAFGFVPNASISDRDCASCEKPSRTDCIKFLPEYLFAYLNAAPPFLKCKTLSELNFLARLACPLKPVRGSLAPSTPRTWSVF